MNKRIALGIDISDSQISMALLKRTKNGAKVLKGGSAPVPEGVIKNGNIENTEALAKAIKELKSRHRIHERKAAISLPVGATFTQILDAPKMIPGNIEQFVQNELKSYIVLSGVEIAFDYCGITSSKGQGERLLAVAADEHGLASVFKTCTQAHIDVEVIEPSVLAYLRALYSEKIEARFDNNVMLAILHGTVLVLCVFRKDALDFIRVENAGEQKEPGSLCQWLAEQINAIIRFYELDVADSSGRWEVTIVADNAQLPEDVEESLSLDIANASLEIRTGENACQDKNIDLKSCKGKPSAPAIGLAMRRLGLSRTNLDINLVPLESSEIKAVKKQFILTAAVIVIAIPMIMRAAGIGLDQLAKNTETSISTRKKTEVSKETYALFKELTSLNKQIEILSKRPAELSDILNSRPAVGWLQILRDVRTQTPNSVRITELNSSRDTGIVLEGLALSYEAARLFEKSLNDSDYINIATLVESSREDNADAFIEYKINCSLDMEKIKI
jgi:Tfp pilus assembly protein PilN